MRALYEAAEALNAEGASAETQGKAFDDAEDEFFRREAFEEFSDDEERERGHGAGDGLQRRHHSRRRRG